MLGDLSNSEKMLNLLRITFLGKLMCAKGDYSKTIRVDEIRHFDNSYSIRAKGGNWFDITYYTLVDESKHLYLIRNNSIHSKTCYWNGDGKWVYPNKAVHYKDEDYANSICNSLSEFGRSCSVIISQHSFID